EVAAKRFRKEADSLQGSPAVKAAGSAGAKDRTRPREVGAESLSMAALGCYASEIITIASAIDPAAIGPGQDQRRHGANRGIVEPVQGGRGPAAGHLGVVVQQLNDPAVSGANAGVGRRREAATSVPAHDPDSSKPPRDRRA